MLRDELFKERRAQLKVELEERHKEKLEFEKKKH